MSTTHTTTDNITDDQIRALRSEARAVGDAEQAAICTSAIGGDDEARAECARVIAAAEAMAD